MPLYSHDNCNIAVTFALIDFCYFICYDYCITYMQAFKINILLSVAVVMFAAKPFIGFSICHVTNDDIETAILAKAFTKRKQEFVKNSDFDIGAVQRRLANPVVFTVLLFSFFLNWLFPVGLSRLNALTGKTLSDIQLRLFPPDHLYLLTGKLSI
jgi:hypothetical protein